MIITLADIGQRQTAEGVQRCTGFAETTAARRAVFHGVVAEITAELRRRMGHAFDLAALSDEYAGAAAWCLDIAQRTTSHPWAHDLSLVQDAAFARIAREAIDFRPTVE